MDTLTGYIVPPKSPPKEVHSNSGNSVPLNSPAKGYTLTQATVSHSTSPAVTLTQQSSEGEHSQATLPHPTFQLRVYSNGIVQPNSPAKGYTLIKSTLSHPTVQLRGTVYLRLHCPNQQSSQGIHSNSGYSVSFNNPAKGYTLTQATVSHPTVQLRWTVLSYTTVQLLGAL